MSYTAEKFDRQQNVSRGGVTDMSEAGSRTGGGFKSEDMFSQMTSGDQKKASQLHAWVAPFYSHLEVLDYNANKKLMNLQKRSDNSTAMHREERQLLTDVRRMGRTPDLIASDVVSLAEKRSNRRNIR